MQWNAPISDAQILGVMSDEGRGLLRGCYWGETTRHGVLDIDQGSKYHNAQELQKLLRVFETVGLRLSIYRSSESGGWHLYFFIDSYVLSQEVETTIKNYLRASGYEIKSGTLEIFPSGNALRLPLQRGFAWLASDGTVEVSREELSQDQALALFYSNVLENQGNWAEAKERIESQLMPAGRGAGAACHTMDQAHEEAISNHGFDGLFFKGVDLDKYERGRKYWASGLSGKSERHDAILSIGHYLWYGDPEAGIQALPGRRNSERRAALIEAWLAEKHNGHSKAVNAGQWTQIKGDIERACSWTTQRAITSKREPYLLTERLISRLCETRNLTPDDFELANARRELKARQKIHAALKDMLAEGRHPTIRGLAEATGCRRETIKKHSDIWGIYAVRGETRLSTGLGDYIAGGLGVISAPVVFSAAPSGSSSVVLEEELKDPPSSAGESSALVLGGSLNFPVAPLFPCLAESLAGAPLRQAQVLRMPTASLTPGPEHAAIQALRHVTAGGTCFSGPVCYSDATTSSIAGRGAAVSRERSQPWLWGQRENKNTVSDATNYKFLTTIKLGYSSEKEDKLSLIYAGANVINFPVFGHEVSLSGAAELQNLHSLDTVHSFYIKLSSQIDVSKSASGHTNALCTLVTKLTPHDVNADDRRFLDFSASVTGQSKYHWTRCTQLIYSSYQECGYSVGRGPPGK